MQVRMTWNAGVTNLYLNGADDIAPVQPFRPPVGQLTRYSTWERLNMRLMAGSTVWMM